MLGCRAALPRFARNGLAAGSRQAADGRLYWIRSCKLDGVIKVLPNRIAARRESCYTLSRGATGKDRVPLVSVLVRQPFR